jgi:hypothetical protein
LKEGGQFGFIVSNKFMRANYGRPLRQLLTTRSRLRQIVDFGELPVFEEAATFPAIVLFQKGAPEDGQAVEVARMKTLDFGDLESEVKRLAYTVTDHGLMSEGWALAGRRLTDILRKTEQAGIPLGKYVDWQIYRGVITGLNEAFFIGRATHDRLIAADPASSELIKPLIVGDDVRRYEIEDRDRYLIVLPTGWTREQCGTTDETTAWAWFSSAYPTLAHYLAPFAERARRRWDKGEFWWELRPCDYYQAFEQPKIVYPDIAKEARFAIDLSGKYPANTIYLIPQQDYFLLALLNSHLLFFFMRQKGAVLGDPEARGRLRFFGQYMEHLPIRHIAFTTPADERARLAGVGITEATEWIEHTEKTSVSSASFSAFSDSKLGQWLDHCLSPTHTPDPALVRQHNADSLNADWQLPEGGPVEQSDVVHDLLAHLAGQMIAMNKEVQAEVRGFLEWLEREVGAPVDDLTGKARLRNYLGDYQKGEPHLALEELLAILRQNRRRLPVDPSARAFQERLAWEYEASLDRLLPLKARLAATDRLIDLIVYRLYELAEEEVTVVEGPGRSKLPEIS